MLKLIRRVLPQKSAPIEVYAEVPHLHGERKARAYVNHGEWKADCPRIDCTNAVQLAPQQGIFECNYCLLIAPVEWPSNAHDIWVELQRRPVPSTRNWFPAGHELAVAARCPHGQTVNDLRDEFAEHGGSA